MKQGSGTSLLHRILLQEKSPSWGRKKQTDPRGKILSFLRDWRGNRGVQDLEWQRPAFLSLPQLWSVEGPQKSSNVPLEMRFTKHLVYLPSKVLVLGGDHHFQGTMWILTLNISTVARGPSKMLWTVLEPQSLSLDSRRTVTSPLCPHQIHEIEFS